MPATKCSISFSYNPSLITHISLNLFHIHANNVSESRGQPRGRHPSSVLGSPSPNLEPAPKSRPASHTSRHSRRTYSIGIESTDTDEEISVLDG